MAILKKWIFAQSPSQEDLEKLGELNKILAAILWGRGFKSEIAAREFIQGKLDSNLCVSLGEDLNFYDPFLFRDMEKAVELIISHIKLANKIIVYGDYDADGVTSSSVLAEVLRTLRAEVDVYLPDRVSEGYGLNKPAIKQLKEDGASLLITVDNGIRNKEEVDYAREVGLDIIITDHHILPDSREDLPQCLFINPSDKEDNYPWPFLAGVGVAFKLASALLMRSTLPSEQISLIARRSLDLVAVGTVADMVNLGGENRLLVKKGIDVLNEHRRFGLSALFKEANLRFDQEIEAWNIGWQLGPRLNAASRLGHANSAFSLINASSRQEAEELAKDLNERNRQRQEITESISSQVEAQVDQNNLPPIIIGVAPEGVEWNEGVVGLVAGRICEKYHRPTLVITRLEEDGRESFKGSGRSIKGFNLIEAVVSCAQHLDKYGGHPMACGFSIEDTDKLEAFKKDITQIAERSLSEEMLLPKLELDLALPFADINLDLANNLKLLAPFGQDNPEPRFASFSLKVEDITVIGAKQNHVKLRLSQADGQGQSLWAIAFNFAERMQKIKIGDLIDVAYYLNINDFRGRQDVQLKLIDWRMAEENGDKL